MTLAGSHDAAVNRLRSGTATAFGEEIKGKEKARNALNWDRGRGADPVRDLHRLVYCAGGLYLLGFLGLGLLLYCLRTSPAANEGSRVESTPTLASN